MNSNNNKILDQALVQSLQFSNSVLLQQNLGMINWSSLALQSPHMPKSKPNTAKSKFQKVLSSKSKTTTNRDLSVWNQSTNQPNPPTNTHTQPPISLESHLSSKPSNPTMHHNVIYEQELQSQTDFRPTNTQTNPKLQSSLLDWTKLQSPFNYQSSSTFMQASSLSQASYSVNDFLKHTAISLSRHNQNSPITAWNSNNKANSPDKIHNHQEGTTPFKAINIINHTQSNLSSAYPAHQKHEFNKINASTHTKKTKFQKPKPSKLNAPPIQTPTKIQPQQITQQQQYIIPCKQKSFDASTRATCELAPSKLQKLIEVEDNKYKQIVLKTYFKHQK